MPSPTDASMFADPDVATLNEHQGEFVARLGLVFDEAGPDHLEAHVDIGPHLHQPFGIVHGGVYASIVETMGSIGGTLVVAPRGKVVVGVSNHTDFLRPVREGRLEIAATPLHIGRLQHLWLVTIKDGSTGKVAARGQLRLQVLDADRALAGSSADEGLAGGGRGSDDDEDHS